MAGNKIFLKFYTSFFFSGSIKFNRLFKKLIFAFLFHLTSLVLTMVPF